MAREYGDRIVFLTSPGLDNPANMKTAVQDFGWPPAIINAVDENGNLWQHFGVRYRGSWVFINQDGKVDQTVGHISDKELRSKLDRLAAA